jgi:hypothetical protein
MKQPDSDSISQTQPAIEICAWAISQFDFEAVDKGSVRRRATKASLAFV